VISSGKAAIVAHDAGGAEILASYVAQNKIDFKLVLGGPAVNVFKRRLGEIEIYSLEEAILDCEWCLCGTGWQSDLEWRAIEQGRNAGKQVVVFLDHWVNYEERFIRNGIQHLPDEIWVGDVDGERLAQEQFPLLPIKLVSNPYFIDIKLKLDEIVIKNNLCDNKQRRVLFVSENISGHALLQHGDERYRGYTEFDVVEFFLKNIDVLRESIATVVLRPHPSDSPGKYDRILKTYPDIVQLSTGKSLNEEIAESDIVVGCESMAMVVGLLAQKKVISCIPPDGYSCRLPQRDIIQFRELVVSK
jgi:hypothetical protein